MEVSVDISLYPLKEEFKKPIKQFINKIDAQSKFKVKRNNMSTSIFGDYKEVMNWITDNMEESLLDDENAVFVLKIVGGNYYRD
ncbi:MAG: thiamine-binding protein [Ichthyobacteriaceae bacterium]|nr:thiamine-binding protein [Ichthyobacteriaceae bacterium]